MVLRREGSLAIVGSRCDAQSQWVKIVQPGGANRGACHQPNPALKRTVNGGAARWFFINIGGAVVGRLARTLGFMNSTPSKFESLLAEDSARKYMVKRFSRRRLSIEVAGSNEAFTALIGDDMIHFNDLRVEIRKALAGEHESAQKKSIYWISFLKPRIETLEYQAAMRASFAAYLSASMALLALGLNTFFGSPVAAGCAAATGFLLAMYLSLRRALIDRRRSWYKYLVAHLEAIKSEA